MDFPHNAKPRLRGYLHQEAFYFALGACTLLIAKATTRVSLLAAILYSVTLITLFGVSALYHRPQWDKATRSILKRIDHSSIFLLIAGTTSPFALLCLPEESGARLLFAVWIGAGLGIGQSIFFPDSPKWVSALLAVIVGWISLPFIGALTSALSVWQLTLVITGGFIYTLGAVVYAIKKPNFAPQVFGYHELFHLLTVFAAAAHFIVVYTLIL